MQTSLADLRRSTRAAVCAECGKCTAVCPLAACGGFNARAIACQNLEEEFAGEGLGIRRCLTCGSCDLRCPQGVRFTDLVRGVRGMAPPETVESCPHGGLLQTYMRIMARNGVAQDRMGWLEDDLETRPDQGEVFFWTGCAQMIDAYFDELGAGAVKANVATVRIMNKLGVKPVVSPEERCCGHDLHWNGDHESFEMLARHNVELLEKSGAKLLVTACAECARTWTVDYQPFMRGKTLRIQHLSEFLAERMGELKFKQNGTRRVTYHDPCRLGRHLGVYEPPRQVLAAMPGVELTEMAHSGTRAVCCAGGTWTHCDRYAKAIQVRRIEEARATEAETMLTACHKCRVHFACAMRDPDVKPKGEIKMQDLADFVAEALE